MKIKTYTISRSTFMPNHGLGWGNGYAVLPKEHPLHGVDYGDIPESLRCDVHGGITYAESAEKCSDEVKESLGLDGSEWVYGFDTAHYCDDHISWPEMRVNEELAGFAEKLESMPLISKDDLIEAIKEKLGSSSALLEKLLSL